MRYTQEDLQQLFGENTMSLVNDLSSNVVLCSTRISTPDGKFLASAARFSSEHSLDMPEMEEIIPIEGTVGGDAVRTGKIQEVPDLSKDRRFSNQKILDAGFTSMMAVPLIFKGEARGVAQIYSKTKSYSFSKKEKQMATTIANNMAAVIVMKEYAEEVERLQRKSFEMEKFRLIGEQAGYITHVIKNASTVVAGFALRIRKIISLCLQSDISVQTLIIEKINLIDRYVGVILSENEKLTQKLRHILSVSKGQPKLRSADICSLLSGIMEVFPSETKEGKKVKLARHFEANATAMIDEGQIREVVNELLQNATEALAQGSSEIAITCRTNLYDGKGYRSVLIEVENAGEIPAGILEQVFDPFFSTKENGSGLGLFGAKVIVKRHGGEIVVKSGNGKTIVRVYLPRQC
ncbi:MAG: GAF domain-containing sensor histidine kinase [Candidatus Lloydbacteria bacterium]|nr:GAF domain-containing sensor histidine kinase [Candidatus Lloydbacteria bacterium]